MSAPPLLEASGLEAAVQSLAKNSSVPMRFCVCEYIELIDSVALHCMFRKVLTRDPGLNFSFHF